MSDILARLTQAYTAKLAEARKARAAWEGKETEMPQEQMDAINAILGEADTIKAQIEQEQAIQAGESFAMEPAGTKAAHLGFRPAGPGEGDVEVDRKAWRQEEIITATGKKLTVRYHVPVAVEQKGYPGAFEAYLRHGYEGMGPNDRKTLQGAIDSAGGHLVPADFQAELIKKAATLATIRPNARVIQTSRDIATWPSVEYTTDDMYTSGVRLTWAGELPASATTIRVTEPTFGMKQIPIHTAMASMPLSNDLLEDSAFDVFGIGAELFAEAFTLGEEDSFINGDGVAQPLGLLGITPDATNGLTKVSVETAGTIGSDDILDLYWAVPAQYRPQAGWWLESATGAILDKLQDSYGRYIMSSLMSGSLATPQVDVIKGKPVHYAEFMPSQESGGFPIIFGDMKGYFIVDRVGLSIQRFTDSKYAELNSSLLLGRKRVGGQLVQSWKLRVLEG